MAKQVLSHLSPQRFQCLEIADLGSEIVVQRDEPPVLDLRELDLQLASLARQRRVAEILRKAHRELATLPRSQRVDGLLHLLDRIAGAEREPVELGLTAFGPRALALAAFGRRGPGSSHAAPALGPGHPLRSSLLPHSGDPHGDEIPFLGRPLPRFPDSSLFPESLDYGFHVVLRGRDLRPSNPEAGQAIQLQRGHDLDINLEGQVLASSVPNLPELRRSDRFEVVPPDGLAVGILHQTLNRSLVHQLAVPLLDDLLGHLARTEAFQAELPGEPLPLLPPRPGNARRVDGDREAPLPRLALFDGDVERRVGGRALGSDHGDPVSEAGLVWPAVLLRTWSHAKGGTRTPTALRPPAPKAGASTGSATFASPSNY